MPSRNDLQWQRFTTRRMAQPSPPSAAFPGNFLACRGVHENASQAADLAWLRQCPLETFDTWFIFQLFRCYLLMFRFRWFENEAHPYICVAVQGSGQVESRPFTPFKISELREGGSGNLTLLDRDGVETSNLNRSPLFTAKDAAEQRRKVDVGQDFLRRIGIGANVIHGPWREVADSVSGQRFDVWVSLTNEDGAWSEVPYHLPPPVLHGTTTSGWGIGFGRHLPGIEDCTGCRLPQPHAQFRGPCAQGVIAEPAEQKQIRASLPFLSTVPGALIAAELLKLNYAQAPSLPNLVQADFRFGVPFLVALRVPR